MTRTLQPDLKEFAPAGDPWRALAVSSSFADRRLSDHIARSEGYAGHASPYELFEEMEDKDAHLFSLLQTRKLGLLARRPRIEPAGDTPDARAAAEWLRRTLPTLPGWHTALLNLLDALGKGLAVVEILWAYDRTAHLVPAAFKPRAAGRFALDADSRWGLIDELNPLAPAAPLPPRKFMLARWNANDDRPHGKGLCEKVYWYYWFKKNNLKFWLVYNEKFGSPTVVARHRAGLSDPERNRLLEVLDSLQNDAGVTVPEGISLELLEAARGGNADTYERLAQWCNAEMARAILGQTLTSGEGERSGSLALGKVHDAVRLDYARADALWLAEIINTQFIRPLIDLNFGASIPAPVWSLDLSTELDLTAEVEVDRQLLRMGIPLPTAYFYEKYNRPAPEPTAPTLTFDDSNLYSYHLQYGILTINEVRAKLGLATVPWGDARPEPATNLSAARSASNAPRNPAGEDAPESDTPDPTDTTRDQLPERAQ